MKRYEILGWFAAFAAVIVVLAAASHVFVVLAGLDSGQNQAIAAWVQAVGSIAAIVGSFVLFNRQWRLQVKAEQERKRGEVVDLAKVVLVFMADARAAVRDSTEQLLGHTAGTPFNGHTDRLSDVQASLRGVAERDVPMTMLSRVLLMQRYVTYSIRALEQRSGSTLAFTTETKEKAMKRSTDAGKVLSETATLYGQI